MSLPPNQELLKHFSSFLLEAGLSAVSAKNYLSDIRHFLGFCNTTKSPNTTLTTEEVFQNLSKYIDSYLDYQRSTFTPLNTANRRSASIRRFSTFLFTKYNTHEEKVDQNTSPTPFVTLSGLQSPDASFSLSSGTLAIQKILSLFKTYLIEQKKSVSTVKNYLSDLNHFLYWSAKETPFTSQTLFNIVSENQLSAYTTYQKLNHTTPSLIARRQSTIKKFAKFCVEGKYISTNPFETETTIITPAPLSWFERITSRPKPPRHDREKKPASRLIRIYKKYNSLPFTPYLHLAILVLATSAMAIFAYNQIIQSAFPTQAFPPTSLQRPTRQLSFQGRLTDSAGTPITTATNVVFRLFPLLSGGSEIYNSSTCSVTPDQNGIFNTLIGDGTCGAEITAGVFSDNVSVFIEVQVGVETLTPRQQIATVGYALNSETLQGYPASPSATENTIPVMNNSGDIVLGSLSPNIESTSGTFTLTGQAITISTAVGSGGNIILQPDTAGAGNVQILTSASTGDQLRVQNANLTDGSLISGYIGNTTDTPALLMLSSGSSETEKFAVRADGQTRITTDATLADGALIVNQTGAGDIFTASQSGATKFVIKNDGKVGIGTTSPNYPLTLVGSNNGATYLGVKTTSTGTVASANVILENSSASQAQFFKAGSGYTTYKTIKANDFGTYNATSGDIVILNDYASGKIILTAGGASISHFTVDTTGLVGIGITNPSQELTVSGDLYVTGGYYDSSGDIGVSGQILSSTATGTNWTDVSGVNFWQRNDGVLSPLEITNSLNLGATATTSALVHLAGTAAENSFINTGNFGIGLTNPSQELTVSGDAYVTGGYYDSSGDIGVSGQLLSSTATGTNWIDQAVATNYWQLNDGVLSPQEITNDLAIGGTATSSATFQVFATTGDASSSGNITHGYGDQIRSQYGPLNLAYKSAADTWTTGITLMDTTGDVAISGTNSSAPIFLDVSVPSISMNSTQVLRLPVQASFTGSIIFGNGGASLTHSATTDGYYNTLVGIGAGNGMTTGYDNTLIGSRAGYSMTTNAGRENTFIGSEAGYHYTARESTMIGFEAGYNHTSGSGNTFLGWLAGYDDAANTSTGNTFIGNQAGRDITGGSNTVLGQAAALSNSSAQQFVAIGLNAGTNIGNGASYSIMIGNSAGSDNNAANNVMIGYSAAANNTTGQTNVFIGGDVAANSVIGNSNNVILGYRAGRGTASYNTATNNVFLGYQSGYSVTTGSSGNVFLGYEAGYSETGSNKLYIENSNSATPLIWGDFTTNVVDINGSLGIGVTNPSQELSVVGDIYVTGGYYDSANSIGTAGQILSSTGTGTAWSAATSVNFWQRNDGVLSPQEITNDLAIGGTATSSALFQVFANTGDASSSGNITHGYGDQIRSQYGPLNLAYKSAANAWTTGITLQDTTGNVGIGTTEPIVALDIPAYNTTNSQLRVGNIEFQPYALNNSWFGDNIYYNGGFKYRNTGYGTLFYMFNGDFEVRTLASGTADTAANPVQHFIVTQPGNVGIGGNQTDGVITGSVLTVLNSGLVGVGITNPSQELTVSGDIYVTGGYYDSSGDIGVSGQVLSSTATGTNWVDQSSVNFWQRVDGALSPLEITNSLNLGATATASALVHLAGTAGENSFINTGNFGIGLTNPGTKLDVTGTGRFSSTLTASNGFTQTTGALNLTATSGALALSGLSASSIDTGANNITFTSGNFNTTATGINSTNIGATTAGTGAFTTLSSTGTTNLGQGSGVVTINSSGALNLTAASASTVTLANVANALNFDANTLTIDALNNRIGIGITNPSQKLQVDGNIVPVTDTTSDLGTGPLSWRILYLGDSIHDDAGTQVIDAQNNRLLEAAWTVRNAGDTTKDIVFDPFSATSTVTVGGGTGKIDVGTVDPPYTINGEKYSTYLSSMIGIKEEITGHLTTSEYVDGVGYRYILDPLHQPEGSDLWVFSKTANLKKNLNRTNILLTAQSSAKAWYEIDDNNNIIVFYSSSPTDISYRLTSPRFDDEKWTTKTPDRLSEGFIINDPDTNINNNGVILPSYTAQITKQSDNIYILSTQGKQNLEVDSFFKLLAANLRAGLAEITEVVADNITVNQKLISPQADIKYLSSLDATVSGTLYADNIQGQTVDSLHDSLSLLSSQYSTASAILSELQAKYSNYDLLTNTQATSSSDILDIANLDTPIASIPGDLALGLLTTNNLITDNAQINGSLFALSLNSSGSDLYIQPDGVHPVHLLGNLLALYPDGKVVINGDLLLSGTLYAQGLDTKDATISGSLALGTPTNASQSGSQLLAFYDHEGSLVSSVDNSGSADFKQIATNELIIAAGETTGSNSTISGTVSSNATIGTATLPANTMEITIPSSKLDSHTLVYLTPVSDTQNQVLFVKSKQEGVGFTVAVPSTVNQDIQFNYWLVKTK